MALFLFTKAILKGEAINIFNNGNMSRDFTYISDIVNCLKKIIFKPSIPNNDFNKINPDPSSSWAPYNIYNIGNSNSISLMDYIYALEQELGIIPKTLWKCKMVTYFYTSLYK